MKTKLTFQVNGANYFVKKPTVEQNKELQNVYNQTFFEALKSKALLRTKIIDFAKSQDIWSDEKENELKELRTKLQNGLFKLAQGGKGGFKKSQAIELAMDIYRLNKKIVALAAPLDAITQNSAESQADNARFNQMMVLCTYYGDGPNEGKQYFANLDDMNDKLDKQDSVTSEAFKNMLILSFGIDKDAQSKRIENKLLIDAGKMDKECRLIDEKGRLIDDDGNLIDDKGRRVNEKGELIDSLGHVINDKGEYVVESVPFVD